MWAGGREKVFSGKLDVSVVTVSRSGATLVLLSLARIIVIRTLGHIAGARRIRGILFSVHNLVETIGRTLTFTIEICFVVSRISTTEVVVPELMFHEEYIRSWAVANVFNSRYESVDTLLR